MTKQEMFNRAWEGLKSQGFERCVNEFGSCLYYSVNDVGKVMRCAWGWVDPAGTQERGGESVYTLRDSKVGIAATLDNDGETFAAALQTAHDSAIANPFYPSASARMELQLRELARAHGLTVPE